MMNMAIPIFDRDLALERAGGSQDLAQELLAMLLNDLPNFLRKIESIRADDVANIIEPVHKLNGAATYCGVPALKSAAHLYETALKMGHTSNFDELHEQLIHEIRRVLSATQSSLPY